MYRGTPWVAILKEGALTISVESSWPLCNSSDFVKSLLLTLLFCPGSFGGSTGGGEGGGGGGGGGIGSLVLASLL
tara:strand:- start:507 stop:731 length:225 start_codon:yes stop_codon:yes gene_type:complete